MSSRRSAVAVPNVKKTIEDYIRDFLQQLGNQFCADCLAKNPQWVAFPHGVIICDNCAGAHRSLGSHVSQVKSVVYDKWTMKMFQELEKCGGNTKINTVLNKYCQHYQQPTPQTNADEREEFIKKKYELKLYTKPQETNEKDESAKRLAHYFLIVGKDEMILPEAPPPNDANNANNKRKPRRFLMPESIFKVEFTKSISYRYPKEDYKTIPLASRIFDFIFPESLRVSEVMNIPEQRAFVLTDAEGHKQYGVAIVFWERISPMDILNMCETLNTFRKEYEYNEITTMPGAVYAPKALALISHWPFFDQFSKFLQTLYRVTKTPSSPIPVERYLMNFMHEVPVPPRGKTSVQFVVGDMSITLRRNPPNSLPFLYVNGLNLFKCLSIGNVLTLFNAVLQEQKIVLISSHLHLLLEAAECITILLFPFQLQGVYMPLLPSKLLDFLHSPVPYLAGVDPSWIKGQHYDDVVFVYLDDDTILTTATETQLEPLPRRPKVKLESALEQLLPWLNPPKSSPNKKGKHKTTINNSINLLVGQTSIGAERINTRNKEEEEERKDGFHTQLVDHTLDLFPISHFLMSGSTIQNTSGGNDAQQNVNESHQRIFREIQRAFLKFFTSIMGNYNTKYTEKQKKNDPSIRNQEHMFFKWNKDINLIEFQREKFLEEGIDKSFRGFMEILTQTQLFMAFCQEREELIESHSKEVPDDIRYFDEEINAKKNRSALRTKKKATQFLDDRSLDLKSVFVANQPNLNDLDANEYNYSIFPNQLRPERFGVVRKVSAPWETHSTRNRSKWIKRTKSRRGNHLKNETFSALQQLMALQHTAHINKEQSWDNFTVQTLIVQRYIRMIIARQSFEYQRNATRVLQRRIKLFNDTRNSYQEFNRIRIASQTLQAVFRTYLIAQKHKNRVYYQSTTTLQAVFRGYLYHKQFAKLYTSACGLQAAFRTYIAQKELRNKENAVSVLQTYILSGNSRIKHLNTMNSISRCQAVLRGTLLRTQQKKVLNMQLNKVRKEILELWQKTFTAFMYRAKFWIVYERGTYLNLAIHNEEIDRLKNLLHRLSTSQTANEEAKQRFDAEKQELRRLLKEELQQNIRESLYTSWGINIKSKQKKDRLLDELFAHDGNTKQSATVLLTICSSHSASILDVTSQVELRKADRIRDNLLLTVFSSLTSMQSLNSSLQKQQKQNRKEKQTIKTLNDELQHKQSIIIQQNRKLTEAITSSPIGFKHHTNHSLYGYPGFRREGSHALLKSGHRTKTNSLTNLRRFSDIGIMGLQSASQHNVLRKQHEQNNNNNNNNNDNNNEADHEPNDTKQIQINLNGTSVASSQSKISSNSVPRFNNTDATLSPLV